MNKDVENKKAFFYKCIYVIHFLVIYGCSTEVFVQPEIPNILNKSKTFKYDITDKFSNFLNTPDNSNLNQEYNINLEFKDSIDVEELEIYLVKSNSNDTIFKSVGVDEISPIINEFGSYDIIIIPELKTETKDRAIIFNDTIKIIDYISLYYQENWNDFISSNQSQFINNSSFLTFLDIPSSEITINATKTFNNFDKCKELKISLKYAIDQKNRASGQNLISRPYFDLFLSDKKVLNVNNGIDSSEEEHQIYYSNISNEFQLEFKKKLTYKFSNWKVIAGSSNTIVENDTIFTFAYDTLKHIGYPKFVRATDTDTSATVNINNSLNKLSFYLEKQTTNNSVLYGQTNFNLDLDGEPFELNTGAGNYILNFNLEESFSPKISLNYGNDISKNKNQFTLYVLNLEIFCL